MINYARQRAIEALHLVTTAVIATSGLAGVLMSEHPCESIELDLYLLLPRTSDHLFNLEQDGRVTLLTAEWELHGKAHALTKDEPQPKLRRLSEVLTGWDVVVRVNPSQIQFRRPDGWGATETIDLAAPE